MFLSCHIWSKIKLVLISPQYGCDPLTAYTTMFPLKRFCWVQLVIVLVCGKNVILFEVAHMSRFYLSVLGLGWYPAIGYFMFTPEVNLNKAGRVVIYLSGLHVSRTSFVTRWYSICSFLRISGVGDKYLLLSNIASLKGDKSGKIHCRNHPNYTLTFCCCCNMQLRIPSKYPKWLLASPNLSRKATGSVLPVKWGFPLLTVWQIRIGVLS